MLHYSWKGSPNDTSPLNTHQSSWLADWLALYYFDSAVWKNKMKKIVWVKQKNSSKKKKKKKKKKYFNSLFPNLKKKLTVMHSFPTWKKGSAMSEVQSFTKTKLRS